MLWLDTREASTLNASRMKAASRIDGVDRARAGDVHAFREPYATYQRAVRAPLRKTSAQSSMSVRTLRTKLP